MVKISTTAEGKRSVFVPYILHAACIYGIFICKLVVLEKQLIRCECLAFQTVVIYPKKQSNKSCHFCKIPVGPRHKLAKVRIHISEAKCSLPQAVWKSCLETSHQVSGFLVLGGQQAAGFLGNVSKQGCPKCLFFLPKKQQVSDTHIGTPILRHPQMLMTQPS